MDLEFISFASTPHSSKLMPLPAFQIRLVLVAAISALLASCGYSQEEWDQKVRENESLRNQLTAQRQARDKCEADYADALQEIEDLKRKLKESGVSLDNLSASLAERTKALEEYSRRAEQLDEIRKRFELLRSKLQKLTQLGLKVEVRDNRMLIQLPGDVLFASGKNSVSNLFDRQKISDGRPHFQRGGMTKKSRKVL